MAFENYYIQDMGTGVVNAEFVSAREQTSYGITLSVHMTETLNLGIEYDTSQYGKEEIDRLLHHMQVLIENAISIRTQK